MATDASHQFCVFNTRLQSGLQKRIDVHSFFYTSLATLSFYPSISCHIYFAWLCIVSGPVTLLFSSLLSSSLCPYFHRNVSKNQGMHPPEKALTYFSLFPTTCFLSSPCQVTYTMTNELWRHAMNLKTPIIKKISGLKGIDHTSVTWNFNS